MEQMDNNILHDQRDCEHLRIPILCNVELVNMIWLLSKVVLHTQLAP